MRVRVAAALAILCLAGPAWADGEEAPLATWSNDGLGGGTIGVMRNGKELKSLPERNRDFDYRVCNGSTSPNAVAVQSQGDNTAAIEIAQGECSACIRDWSDVHYRNGASVNTTLFGTYAVYKRGGGCRKPLAVGEPVSPSVNCVTVPRQGEVPQDGFYMGIMCPVPLGRKAEGYRLCFTSGSLRRGDGSVFENYSLARVVLDRELLDRNANGETGQPRLEFSRVSRGCIDLFNVDEIWVAAGSAKQKTGDDSPYGISRVELTLQTLGKVKP